MVVELEVALEHAVDTVEKSAIGVQPRHFVLVLVSHQFEKIARHGFRQHSLADGRRFRLLDARDKGAVLPGVGCILVARQEFDTTRHQALDRLTLFELDHLAGRHQLLYRCEVVRGTAAPLERRLVVLDGDIVQLDGAHQRCAGQRHPATLPRIAQQHRVGVQAVAHQRDSRGIGVETAEAVEADDARDLVGAIVLRIDPVGVAHEGRRRRAVAVERHVRSAFTHARQGLVIDCHQRVGRQDQVGRGRADPRGADGRLAVADQHMAPGRAALLRQPGRVLRDDALALDVRRHAEQLADGDDTGATDAGHHDAPHLTLRQLRHQGLGYRAHLEWRVGLVLRLLLQRAAFDRHEARAKALQAAHVLVAAALVDGALAAELGLQWLDRQAIALHAAVAAAFAHQLVDDHALGRVDGCAALATAALFGGAGLVVDDDRGALDLPELALDLVQQVAVPDLRIARHFHAVVFLGFVGDDHDFLRAFGLHALRDLQHRMAFGALTDRLSAGHGDRVVVEDLVGDVDARRDGLADRQQAAVKVRAIAQVGEDVLVGGERLLADPGHALAAHLREADGAAVHPRRHEMTADAAQRARAFGHHGAGVVRAAGAEPRLPVGAFD